MCASIVLDNSVKTHRLFFLVVEIKPSILAYISAPLKVRKLFDIFWLSFAGLIPLFGKVVCKGNPLVEIKCKHGIFLPDKAFDKVPPIGSFQPTSSARRFYRWRFRFFTISADSLIPLFYMGSSPDPFFKGNHVNKKQKRL